jgi:uncharacterized cupredoxin-like copper-binding protein
MKRAVTTILAYQMVACGVLATTFSCNPCGTMGAGTTVNVTEKEFTVTPDVVTAAAGCVTFHVSNTGNDTHEFLVIKTDLAEDALPTESDGSYEENGPGTELLDEISEIAPGASADLTLNLAAGKYVLICNMVDLDEAEVHYQLGMHAAFTVQ